MHINYGFYKTTEGIIMNEPAEKKYWLTANNVTWVIILVVSFFVFFPAFIALVIIWAVGKIKVND